MTQWTDGYVAGMAYTHGYYRELGFGQGLSTNIHAAASNVAWHGTDLNLTQAGFAAQLAHASGSGAQLVDQSFAEYCARTDLPDFDFIALHGVWSWVSSANRELLSGYIERMTAPGAGLERRIDAALAFADRLLATRPAYLEAYPQPAERLAGLRAHDHRYLDHEYFNADWQPVDFAGQGVRDLMLNQHFRRDYWVKNDYRMTPAQHAAAMRSQRVVLVMPRTVAALEPLVPMRGGVRQLFEAVFILCDMGVLAPAQAPEAAAAAGAASRRLNLALYDRARQRLHRPPGLGTGWRRPGHAPHSATIPAGAGARSARRGRLERLRRAAAGGAERPPAQGRQAAGRGRRVPCRAASQGHHFRTQLFTDVPGAGHRGREHLMNDWTGGYVADLNYTYGYYQELSPQRIALAFASAGLEAPATGTACELGYGQGLGTNIHAAASITRWHGTDFNPAQAAFARELAHSSGNGAQLVDQSFAEFCGRADLPDFDYICLHGIWCWVSPENQSVIVDFIRRKLKVGGVLYISYNCQPGWAPMVPIRGLLTQYADAMTSPGMGRTQRVDSTLDFTDRLLATEPAYFGAYPRLAERLKALRGENRLYLVHEYFSGNGLPTSFADMANTLGQAKLTYACPAHYLEHIADLNLSRPQQALLAELPDPVLAQSVRDIMVNQNFRADYWVKGARPLTLLQKAEAMRRPRVVMVALRKDVDLKITGRAIEAQLSDAIYQPMLALMADFQPRTVGELAAALASHGLDLQQVFEAVLVLLGKGSMMVAQEPAAIDATTATSHRLNRALFQRARDNDEIAFIASPVVGAGVWAPRIVQLFLLAHVEGLHGVDALTDYVWQTLSLRDQRMVKDGVPLDAPADNIAEIRQQAGRFESDYLAMYRALGVIA